MDTISKLLDELKNKGKTAFIPFITAGDPNLEVTRDLVFALEKGGADIIELGVPFSDPLADGPTIQRASERALASGTSLLKIIDFVKEIRTQTTIPIVLMSYFNPIFRLGINTVISKAIEAGINGFIIPDLPPEEADDLIEFGLNNKIAIIFFLAPTSSEKRIVLVSKKSTGYIYYVSVTGVTGTRNTLDNSLKDQLLSIRKFTKKPIAVGFGISTPKQAKEVSKYADAVIIGSAIVKIIESKQKTKEIVYAVEKFAEEIKKSL
ncbi:MAG: tryptophan synthase subunit alpha [bacterium]